MQKNIKIEDITKEDILKMTRACLYNNDRCTAKEFLNLCHKKRRNMRKTIKDIQYLLIDKDDIKKTIKYIDILLKKQAIKNKK